MATRYLPAMYFLLQISGSHGTGDDMIGVSGVHYGVTIAVKNDGRDKRLLVFKNVPKSRRTRKSIVNRLAAWRRMQR